MMLTRSTFLRGLAAASLSLAASLPAWADAGAATYEVTLTNLSHNQRFTPLLLATHRPDIAFFVPGQPASAALRALAEDGNVAPLRAWLQASPKVTDTTAGNALLAPGQSVTFTLQGHPLLDRLSLAGMLIPTNDAFVALNTLPLPGSGRDGELVYPAVAWDAGTEVNDELCSSIPGPSFDECGGSGGGARVGGGEGFVHVHRGMHGVGQFAAGNRDWRNPVAEVRVRRVR